MGLFEKKKKDAERCPICGKEISFFSGLVIDLRTLKATVHTLSQVDIKRYGK